MTTLPTQLSTDLPTDLPTRRHYDTIIIGGAIMGASTAWHLTDNPDYNGTTLVIERDPSYQNCSTSHTNSCIRQQFSTTLNIRISQHTAHYIKNLRANMGGDPRIPTLTIHNFGYLYLANTHALAATLRANHKTQRAAGAQTQLLTPQQIQEKYPFYNLDDIQLGSINYKDEGYWDGSTVFHWWRRQSAERGVEYIGNEVTAISKNPTGTRIQSITLKTGHTITCGQLVNASGPRAARTAAMAGIPLPVEPRKRYTWIFKAEKPLERDLPLTIDPSGVHVRENGGGTYQCGAHSSIDPAADPNDFTMHSTLWQDHVWPALAARIPRFEAIKVQTEWCGHYAYNTIDQNAIVGPHPSITNFIFLNGFSGHGLQQSPAMGRGVAEWLTHGEYRTLDLHPFSYQRITDSTPLQETAVI